MGFEEKTLKEFLQETAFSAPTPGGGGVSAYAAAIGMALSDMVGALTVGKKKYAAVEKDILRLKKKAAALEEEFLSLVTKDGEVFSPLAAAYGLPKETEEEKQHREEVMERCLLNAAEVPLTLMEKCCEGIELSGEFAEKGSRMAISDAGVSAALLLAALKGAALNVFINTAAMKDRMIADQFNKKANQMLDAYVKKADDVYELVRGKCSGSMEQKDSKGEGNG